MCAHLALLDMVDRSVSYHFVLDICQTVRMYAATEEVTAVLQIPVHRAQEDTVELNVNYRFVLAFCRTVREFAPMDVETVLLQIPVLVHLDGQEINVRHRFATENWPEQDHVQIVEIVLHLMFALRVPVDMEDLNVNYHFVLAFCLTILLYAAIEEVTVVHQTTAPLVQLDGQELNVICQNVLDWHKT
jgi:hypothetical protein